jgi:hypothetical protein
MSLLRHFLVPGSQTDGLGLSVFAAGSLHANNICNMAHRSCSATGRSADAASASLSGFC